MEGQKKLQVNCSPGTFAKINSDPQLVENYTQQLMETQGHFDEVVFTTSQESSGLDTVDEIFTPIVDSHQTPDENISSMWTDSATKLLLDEVKKLWDKVGKSLHLKSKSQLWKVIAEKLSKEGYPFSQNQVEGKFRSLERQYKKVKLNNAKTGRNRLTCVHQSELDEVFGAKKSINPEFILESEFQPPSPQLESSQEAVYDGPSTSKNAAKLNERGKFLQKLEEISKRKEDRQQKLLQFLEKTDEDRKAREKQKEELGKEMVNLLKELANNFKK